MQIGGSGLSYRIDYASAATQRDDSLAAEPSTGGSFRARGEEPEAKDPDGTSKDPAEKAQQQQVIAQLQARDTEVRAHESAHLAAAGGIAAGGASFTYQKGPDGRMYAIGGEVPIAVEGGDDPQETIAKMRQVAAAAMAPADPSPQDYAVAANARSEEMRALRELRKEQAQTQKAQGADLYGNAAETSENRSSETSLDIEA